MSSSQLQSSGLLGDGRSISNASSSPLPPAKLDVDHSETKQEVSPLPNAQSLSSAMPVMIESTQDVQEDHRSREVSPLTVPSTSEAVTSSDPAHQQNVHLYHGNFAAITSWARHEQHSFQQPIHPLPSSQGYTSIQPSQAQPIPQAHVQVQSQRPQIYLQAPQNHPVLQQGHQHYANSALPLPYQNHNLNHGQHQNRNGRQDQYPSVHHPQQLYAHQNSPLDLQPQSAGLGPYSPLYPAAEDIEYHKYSQSLQEGQFASMQAMQAANAACYSPVYHSTRFSVSPAPASSMMQERHPFQMAPASAPHRVKRKSGGYQPYYIPSQQMQSQVQPQVQVQSQNQLSMQMSNRRPPPPPISIAAMKQETYRASPQIQPSSITMPAAMPELRQGSFNNQQGPHYGRLPDGSIIELYPAMVRTMHACEYCRSRKAKCSGGNPCERCEKRDVDCVYAQFEKTKKHKARKSAPGGGSDQQRTSTSGSGSSSSQTSKSRMNAMDAGGNRLSIEVGNRERHQVFGMNKKPLRRSPRFATFDDSGEHDPLHGLGFSSTGPYHFASGTKTAEGVSGGEGGGGTKTPHSPKQQIASSGPPLMPTLNSTTNESDLLSPSSTTSSSSAGSDNFKRGAKVPLESSAEVSSSHEALSAFNQSDDVSLMMASQSSSFARPGKLIRSVFQ